MNFVTHQPINNVHDFCRIWYYLIVPLLFDLSNVVQLSKVGPVSPTVHGSDFF